MTTRALQQVDTIGRPTNRLIDLRARVSGSGGGGDDVQFFKITAVGESVLTATHMVLDDEGAWEEGSLGTGIEIAPYPDSTIANYIVDDYIVAVELTEGWAALTDPLPNGTAEGDMLVWDADTSAYIKLAAPSGVSKTYQLVATTNGSGVVSSLEWVETEPFGCSE